MESISAFIGILLTSAATLLGLHSSQQSEVESFSETDTATTVFTEIISASGDTVFPLSSHEEREVLLTFGQYVTPDPDQNPIDPPERFTGYHTAIDYEILEGEEDAEVPVSAIADGEILFSGEVSGYGGVLIQSAVLAGKEVTILYGHLQLSSLATKGTTVMSGDRLGALAPANSRDSGYTRKHLHLSIHTGATIDFLGYVQKPEELDAFIDPMTVLPILKTEEKQEN